jgi:predicted RND superfamily exporter protein
MWSFSFSDVAPVADLGIFASASIVLGLLFVLFFIILIIMSQERQIISMFARFSIRISGAS